MNLKEQFFPSKEIRIKWYEQLIEMMQKQKGQCSTCKWIIGPDPSLPRFVTDYGRCGKEQICFAARVCNLEPLECESYEYDDTEECYYRKRIEELRKELK